MKAAVRFSSCVKRRTTSYGWGRCPGGVHVPVEEVIASIAEVFIVVSTAWLRQLLPLEPSGLSIKWTGLMTSRLTVVLVGSRFEAVRVYCPDCQKQNLLTSLFLLVGHLLTPPPPPPPPFLFSFLLFLSSFYFSSSFCCWFVDWSVFVYVFVWLLWILFIWLFVLETLRHTT